MSTLDTLIHRNQDFVAFGRHAGLRQGATPGPGWNLIVLHHTDCGITRLGDHPGLRANVLGVDPGDLAAKAVGHPAAAVAVDVAAIRANPFLPGAFLVSGLS